jgi:hypothetical protein
MCSGRVPGRSDVPVELAAGIRIIRLALAFPTKSGGRKPPVVNVSSLQMEYACVLGAFTNVAMFRSNLQLENA